MTIRHRARWALPLLLLAAGSAQAQSGMLYRWTDPYGTTRYDDRIDAVDPRATATAIPVHGEPTAVARLRLQTNDRGGHLAWVENTLGGPIEVMLHATSPTALASDPPLPARATVPAGQGVVVAALASGSAELRVEAVPGDPNARPHDVEYGFPLGNSQLRIQQAWGGRFSHDDTENRYAVDFAAAVGTPVRAARDGRVMQTEARFIEADQDTADAAERANFIRVLHDDGSMALYAHLQHGGVHVRVGQRVRRGQTIGLSGNTGRSTAPHLHFVVQANRGMRLESVPFRMFGPHGILRFGVAQGGGDTPVPLQDVPAPPAPAL